MFKLSHTLKIGEQKGQSLHFSKTAVAFVIPLHCTLSHPPPYCPDRHSVPLFLVPTPLTLRLIPFSSVYLFLPFRLPARLVPYSEIHYARDLTLASIDLRERQQIWT